jgi:hypothetical protein
MVSILDFATSVVATYPVETAPDRADHGLGRKGFTLVGVRKREKFPRDELPVVGYDRGPEPV